MHGESYIARLRRETAVRRALRAAARTVGQDPRAKLKARITNWYWGLPPEVRAPHYVMEDLVRQLRAPAQQLGLALRELGWRCERVWRKGQPYRHRWAPPDLATQQDSRWQPPELHV